MDVSPYKKRERINIQTKPIDFLRVLCILRSRVYQQRFMYRICRFMSLTSFRFFFLFFQIFALKTVLILTIFAIKFLCE